MATVTSIQRRIRICRWRARVNALWLWAYCALTLVVHGYLLYRAVSRCKDYNELPWRIRNKPVVELYAYISLIVLSVMCLPFFLIAAIFTTGNYPGDGVRLGRDNIHQRELAAAAATVATSGADPDGGADAGRGEEGGDDGVDAEDAKDASVDEQDVDEDDGTLRKLWRHVGPFSHGFHVVSAFSLLIPSVLLEAQEIKYGFRDPEAAWHTDLNWLFGSGSYPDRSNPFSVASQVTSTVITSPVSPGDRPYAEERDDVIQNADVRLGTAEAVSPEYVNYVVALVFYSIRYASVFWYTKMSFSLVFVGLLFVITLHFAVSFCGMAILYRLQENKATFSELDLLLPPSATLAIYLLANAFLLACTLAVYAYGHQQYRRQWWKFVQRYAPRYRRNRKSADELGYGPHVTASLLLLLVVVCRGAIVYDYVIVYRRTGFPLVLACVVVDAVYLVTWIGTWFGFTLKQRWSFQIALARYVVAEEPPEGGTGAVTSKSLSARGDDVDAGAYRKSKSKRGSASIQRVKFDQSTHAAADDASSKRNRNGYLRGRSSGHVTTSSSEAQLGDSTPENTLTRTYRHSLRDQCGLYFRISRDLTSAPAAHSSPVPCEVRDDRKLTPEIVLDPLSAGRRAQTSPGSGTEPAQLDRSNDSGVQLRRIAADRKCYPAPQDSRYSYPLACSPADSWLRDKLARGPPPAYFRRDTIPTRHSVHLERPRDLTESHVTEQPRPIPWCPDTPTRPMDEANGRTTPPPPPPRPPKRDNELKILYRSRDLKIITKRSDRDSALPSSNETSASDTNDVLCSQV